MAGDDAIPQRGDHQLGERLATVFTDSFGPT
jgi:hypothetical protein